MMRWPFVLWAALVVGCVGGEAPTAPTAGPEAVSATVELVGCAERRILADGSLRCELEGDASLTLSVRRDDPALAWLVGVVSQGGQDRVVWKGRFEGARELEPHDASELRRDAEAVTLRAWALAGDPGDGVPSAAPALQIAIGPRAPLPAGEDVAACTAAAQGQVSDEAVSACQRAIDAARRLPDEGEVAARLGVQLALGMLQAQAYDAAAPIADRAGGEARAAGLLSTELAALQYATHARMMIVRANQASGPEAREAARDCSLAYLRRALEVGATPQRATALRKTGETLLVLGEPAEAETILHEACILGARHWRDPLERLNCSQQLGKIYHDRGEFGAALAETDAMRRDLLRLAHEADSATTPGSLSGLEALQGTARGSASKALGRVLFVEAAAIRSGVLGPERLDVLVSDLQVLDRVLGARAEDGFKAGLLCSVAAAVCDRGVHELTDRLVGELTRLPADESPSSNVMRALTLAQIALARGDVRTAALELAAAERIGEIDPNYTWAPFWVQARLLEAKGDRVNALAKGRAALDAIEQVALSKAFDERQAIFVGMPEVVQAFIWVEEQDRAAGRLHAALSTAERRRVLFDVVSDARRGLGDDAATSVRVEAYHRDVEVVHDDLRVQFTAEPLARLDTVSRIAELRALRETLLGDASRGSPAARRIALPASLARQTVMIELSASSDGHLVAYRWTAEGLEARTSAVRLVPLADEIEAFNQALRAGHVPAPAPGLAALGELLAWATPEGTTHLVVIPWGPTWRLPFSLVAVEGEPLVRRVSVSIAPSIKAMTPPSATHGQLRAVVLGDPTGDLDATRTEAQQVAERFGTAALLGPEATRRALLGALDSADLIHFAGHAVRPLEGRFGSHLLVAGHHLVTPWDLTFRAVVARLVVLSACATGDGARLGPGDEYGLPTAFLAAGSGAVLATLWPLEQGDAGALLLRFYDEWDGTPAGVAPAWARVQRHVLDAAPSPGALRTAASFVVWTSAG